LIDNLRLVSDSSSFSIHLSTYCVKRHKILRMIRKETLNHMYSRLQKHIHHNIS